MLGGILSPAFLQAAGNDKKFSGMRLFATAKNPTISTVYCEGEITVTSIANGQKKVVTYSDLEGESLQIQADALTTIKIEGNLTGGWEIGSHDFGKISVKNTALESLSCSGCSALQELNVSANTALTSLTCTGCSKAEIIFAIATNNTVATAIANLITANAALMGTVYANSADTYYSTIETAAQGAGWTIAPLVA